MFQVQMDGLHDSMEARKLYVIMCSYQNSVKENYLEAEDLVGRFRDCRGLAEARRNQTLLRSGNHPRRSTKHDSGTLRRPRESLSHNGRCDISTAIRPVLGRLVEHVPQL